MTRGRIAAGAAGAGWVGVAALLLMGQVNVWGIVQPNGYQQIASFSGVQSLTIPAGTSYASVCVETNAVRWRDDNVAPTASIGMPVASGSCIPFAAPSPNLQFIPQTGSATLDISYYR